MMNKFLLKVISVLFLATLESVSGIALGFVAGDNSLSLISNLSPKLIADDPKVYRRVILEAENVSVSDENWQSIIYYENRKYYQESVIFRLEENSEMSFKTDGEILHFPVSLTDYNVHRSHNQFVYQDLGFENESGASGLQENEIIIPSTIAEQLWAAGNSDEPYSSDLICGKTVEINGVPKTIGAIYDVELNRQVTNSFWYRNYGETVFLAADEFYEAIPEKNPLIKYFFTVNSDASASTAIAEIALAISETLSVPDLHDNQLEKSEGVDAFELEKTIKNVFHGSHSLVLTIFCVLLELFSVVLHISMLVQLKSTSTGLLMGVAALSLLLPIFVFAICAKLVQFVVIDSVVFYLTTRTTSWIVMVVSILTLLPVIAILLCRTGNKNASLPVKTKRVNLRTRNVKI